MLQFADIANGKPLPDAAVCEIDLWTGCIAGGLPVDDWCAAIEGAVEASAGLQSMLAAGVATPGDDVTAARPATDVTAPHASASAIVRGPTRSAPTDSRAP